nr:retrovirus-related Pol polyprotein from transposon TNT 1-94 [Tanacetum cinerariifolium]
MYETMPPIPPPLGTSSGSTGNPNVNRVDTMPTISDPINTTTTTNVSQSVVDENLLNFLILEEAHEGPSDIRDTKIVALRLKFNAFKSLKGEKVNGTFTRLKCLLNDLENNGVSIPQAKVNATFVNSLPRKRSCMNQTQRANNSIKNDYLATLYGKYNYEEGLIDHIYESEIQRFNIQASSSKALISNNHFQDSDSHVKEDQRTSNEFMADLNAKYHERALLENQKRAFMAIAEDGSYVGKANARSEQWIDITIKKADESSSMSIPNITSDSESECETQEPLPPLLKLIGAAPSEHVVVKKTLIKLKAQLPLNPTCGFIEHLTNEHLEHVVVKKMLIKLKAQLPLNPTSKKDPMIPKPFKECKYYGFNNHHSENCEYYPGCEESGPKVVFGDDSLGDTEGYSSINCNGITFIRVAYVDGLKHNLISIIELCNANFKVLFKKTHGTIFNQNDEGILIAPRRRDVYIIDMSSYNKESNTGFFAKASPRVN